ncbi:MAG: mechanosensitive ion channel family protein, partial [Polyangiaceae bacterium]
MKPILERGFLVLTFVGVSLFSATAFAQDVPDVTKIAGFVRWGGILFSVLVIIGAMVVLKIISDVSDRLGGRFANRRPTIQKYESVGRFIVYIVAVALALSLSLKLDSTTLAVVGGTLAVAVGFAMRDLVAAFIAGITIIFDRPFQV